MAGTPGACSQVFCHPISCMPVMRYRQRYVINTSSVPQPPQPPQTPQPPQPQQPPQPPQQRHTTTHNNTTTQQDNNNNTIWTGSVLTGEEPPPHSGELKHALPQAGGPTQSQLSRFMSSGHHISMEHRLRRKQLNSDIDASNKKYLKEIQEKRKEETFIRKK